MSDTHKKLVREHGAAMSELTLASRRNEPDLSPYADRVTAAEWALLAAMSAAAGTTAGKPREPSKETIKDVTLIYYRLSYLSGLADGMETRAPTAARNLRDTADEIDKTLERLRERLS